MFEVEYVEEEEEEGDEHEDDDLSPVHARSQQGRAGAGGGGTAGPGPAPLPTQAGPGPVGECSCNGHDPSHPVPSHASGMVVGGGGWLERGQGMGGGGEVWQCCTLRAEVPLQRWLVQGRFFPLMRWSHTKFPLLIRTHHVLPSPSPCCCCAVPAAEQEADDSGSDSDGR